MGFQTQDAVDHMDPGTFQLLGPLDVVVFIKAGLELHQGHHLLAVFGRPNQGRHDRRIAGGAVERHLDGEHRRVIGRLVEEFLNGGGEEVVGVLQEHVAPADHREDAFEFLTFEGAIFQLAFLGAGQGGGGAALVGLGLQAGHRQCHQFHQVVKTEGAIDAVHVFRFHRHALHQHLHHRLGHFVGDFQPHHFSAPAAFAQSLLQGLHEVIGLQFAELQVRIPGHTEEVMALHLHAWE